MYFLFKEAYFYAGCLPITSRCASRGYRELGPGHADEQALASSKRWAIRRLEQLGFAVTLNPKDREEGVA